jgi:hypothetical protein
MQLPMLIHDQDELPTLNSNDQPVFHDAIMPGVDVQPLSTPSMCLRRTSSPLRP